MMCTRSGWPCSDPVAARDLRRGVDGVAAAGARGTPWRRPSALRGEPRGERVGRRVGEVAERRVGREPVHLRRDGARDRRRGRGRGWRTRGSRCRRGSAGPRCRTRSTPSPRSITSSACETAPMSANGCQKRWSRCVGSSAMAMCTVVRAGAPASNPVAAVSGSANAVRRSGEPQPVTWRRASSARCRRRRRAAGRGRRRRPSRARRSPPPARPRRSGPSNSSSSWICRIMRVASPASASASWRAHHRHLDDVRGRALDDRVDREALAQLARLPVARAELGDLAAAAEQRRDVAVLLGLRDGVGHELRDRREALRGSGR